MKYFEVYFMGDDISHMVRADSAEDAARQVTQDIYGKHSEVTVPDREYFDVVLPSVNGAGVEDRLYVEERGNK